jgi:hypothetical protein
LIDRKNNIEKFEGEDCMFQLAANELENLRCKNFTSYMVFLVFFVVFVAIVCLFLFFLAYSFSSICCT